MWHMGDNILLCCRTEGRKRGTKVEDQNFRIVRKVHEFFAQKTMYRKKLLEITHGK